MSDPFNTAIDSVMKFMRFHGLPREGAESLGERMKSFYSTYYASRSMVDDKDIVENLTPSLRFEVMEHLLARTVHACPLLQPYNKDVQELSASFVVREGGAELLDEHRLERHRRFHEQIYWQMKPVVYRGRESVIAKHTRNRDLYFLMNGQVLATDLTMDSTQGAVFDQMLFSIHERGAVFGEQCLLRMSSRSLLGYIAATPTQLLSIDGDALVEAANEHLDAEEREAMAEQIWTGFHRKEWQHKWGKRILVADLKGKLNLWRENGVAAAEQAEVEQLIAVRIIQNYRLQRLFRERNAKTAEEMLPRLMQRDSDTASETPTMAPQVFGAALGKVHAGPKSVPSEAFGALKDRVAEQGRQLTGITERLDRVLQLLQDAPGAAPGATPGASDGEATGGVATPHGVVTPSRAQRRSSRAVTFKPGPASPSPYQPGMAGQRMASSIGQPVNRSRFASTADMLKELGLRQHAPAFEAERYTLETALDCLAYSGRAQLMEELSWLGLSLGERSNVANSLALQVL